MPARPDLVVLDCDGVLVDTERLQVVIESRVLTDLGWPMPQEEVVRRWMGRSAADQRAEVAHRLGEATTVQYEQRVHREVAAAFAADLTEVPGVSALLDALDRAEVPTCVASSGTHARMEHTLGITGLHHRLRGRLFSASEVSRGKPAPDLFLHAAERMGVAPERCVVLEDSATGVRAGVAARMRVLGYAGGLAGAQTLEEAGAEVFVSMDEVPALLGL